MKRIPLGDLRFALGACALLAFSLGAPDARAQSAQGIGLSSGFQSGSERTLDEETWARMLIEGLGLGDTLGRDAPPSEAFSLLCSEAAEMTTDGEGRRVPAHAAFWVATGVAAPRNPGEPVRVVLEAPATALYQLAIEGEGLQRWTIDQRAVAHVDPTALGVAVAPELIPLRKGSHELAGYMGRRARVDRIELAAFRSLCIAPADGWHAERSLTHGAAARTLVRALGVERYLPERGKRIEIEGEDYSAATGWGGRTNEGGEEAVSGRAWARAGESAAEFTYRVRIVEPGVYALRARIRGAQAQIWSIDARYRIGVQGDREAERFASIHVMTVPLASGEHVVRALVPRGGGVDSLRISLLRSGSADYVDAIEQMGLAGGASDGLVKRSTALANLMHPAFVELAADFRERTAVSGMAEPVVAVDVAPPPLYTRPLGPVLPSEL